MATTNANDTSKINAARKLAQQYEGDFKAAVSDSNSSYFNLRQQSDILLAKQQEHYFSPNSMDKLETKHQKMMKMQKQYDIRNMVEIEQSIIIFTGIGLVFLGVVGVLILKK